MFDFPTILCCFNYANIYCLEVTCLISTTSIFPLTLIGIINIKWGFIDIFCEILYSINLAITTFTIFTIVFITLATTSKRILMNNYYKPFSQVALVSAFIFVFLFISFTFCAIDIINIYYKIKNDTYDFKDFNKFEIRKIKDFIKYQKNFVLVFITTLIPLFFSLLNIFLWLSIYYRISFRIYCSFNYEIRNELRKFRKKEMSKLEEETTNDTEKSKKNKIENVEISVVFEKDRHPSYRNNIMNLKRNNDLGLNNIKSGGYKEEFSTGNSSTKRNININNNILNN